MCAVAGSRRELQAAAQRLGVTPGVPGPDGKYLVTEIPCLGLCDHAPNVLISHNMAAGQLGGDYLVGPAYAAQIDEWLPVVHASPGYFLSGEPRWLTGRIGQVDPTSLDDFVASGGFEGLRSALKLDPAEVIDTVKRSGLVGRGGAAFPTGIKLQGTADADGQPKYIVLNADESEIGTFKDRVLVEFDPYTMIEGMLISAYAVGAELGIIYVRGEYQHAQEVLNTAIQKAEAAGYLGENILGSGLTFQIELRSGAGAYICGEETALFESVEGKRGFPRMKPPFPTTHGVFGKPTVINNVETIANLPVIFQRGVAAYRSIGTQKSPGSKLFCLSGDVQQPGLVEVPFGLTLRTLIEEYGQGVTFGSSLQAVLLGGAAGVFVPPDQLDVPLTFEDTREQGLALGSGAVMVFDHSRDLRQILLNIAHFFAHESCGKCYPCQLGTQRQLEILERLAEGRLIPGDLERLQDTGWTMTDASLCGLGQTAALAVLSAMKHWPEMFSEA
jgi:NADH-quinone oxidoreductase subunit F